MRIHPTVARVAFVLPALLLLLVPARPAGQASPPEALLRTAREAMGGDAAVRGVRSLRLSGSVFATQTVLGGYTQDTEDPMEVRFAFPDRYLKVEARAFGSNVIETQTGFVGNRSVYTLNSEASGVSRGFETYVRNKAAELLLIVLARHESWSGLQFETAGPDAIRVRGPGDYAALLEFDPATHLPARLLYRERRQVRPRNTILRRGQSSPPSGSAAGRTGGSAAAGANPDTPVIEIAITFHDHQRVDGLLLPHRITTTAIAADMLLWELRFTRIEVNPAFTDADFGG